MIRNCTTFFAVLVMGFFLVGQEAEAGKRFGGGKSFGQSYSTPKQVQPSAPTANRQASDSTAAKSATATQAPKRSGMMGMLGGLLAGGLLGALLFGGAFDGVQLMDILLIALVGFVAFKLFARARQSQPQPQYAGGYAPRQAEPVAPAAGHDTQQASTAGFEPTPLMSTRLAETALDLPEWFNKDAFLNGAKQHFGTLQRAWDDNDLEEIKSYTSAELFAELKAERERLGDDDQHTEVVSVMAELLNFINKPEEVVLSVNFYGWIREGRQAETREFNEIWHLTRDMTQSNTDWVIVGIEQPQ